MGRWALRITTGLVLLFLYVPIVIVILYAFNAARDQTWPITRWTTEWFGVALDNSDLHDAFVLSVEAALGATVVALLLGTLASLAVHRFTFFGRDTVSFMLVLPIALPGIVTGMALNATFNSFHVPFSLWTIIVGHATFCVVTVYNNTIARMRRSSRSIEEASMDLGATPWQTFRHVTFPVVRTALVAGGLLAFALSFDEVIVTTFTAGTQQTIPLWIFNNLKLPNQRSVVNVVAVFLIILSLLPVYLAQRLTSEGGHPAGRA
jgi:putative spermidine/putrescine transport system permease protein